MGKEGRRYVGWGARGEVREAREGTAERRERCVRHVRVDLIAALSLDRPAHGPPLALTFRPIKSSFHPDPPYRMSTSRSDAPRVANADGKGAPLHPPRASASAFKFGHRLLSRPNSLMLSRFTCLSTHHISPPYTPFISAFAHSHCILATIQALHARTASVAQHSLRSPPPLQPSPHNLRTPHALKSTRTHGACVVCA